MAVRAFRVLGGQLCRADAHGVGIPLRLTPENEWLLLAALLEGGFGKRAAREALGATDVALRKRVSRLARDLGLEIPAQGGRFSLETEVEVDAHRLVALVEQSRRDPGNRRTLLQEARSLWGTGLPRPAGLPSPAPDFAAALEVARAESQRYGRRILVVDDRIAERLASRLRANHECETATSSAAVEPFMSRLHEFDLVVVDHHLDPEWKDSAGFEIVRAINGMDTAVPVMMMTYRPAGEESLADDKFKYGLVDNLSKGEDGDKANIGRLATRIEQALEKGPVGMACLSIRQHMLGAVEGATIYINGKYAERERAYNTAEMQRVAAVIDDLAKKLDLRAARREWVRFNARWYPT